MRHLRYWVSYVLRYRTLLICGQALDRVVTRIAAHRTFEGITIVAPPVDEGEPEPPFLRCTVETLELIRTVDPRRFRRLQREFLVIADDPLPGVGRYIRPLRRCAIDFARYDPDLWRDEPEWSRWLYATTLIHEATHGAVYSRHIMYTKALRTRIERLCCMEARRFATRADGPERRWSDALVPPFDVTRWQRNWNMTLWQRLKEEIKRYREVVRQRSRSDR